VSRTTPIALRKENAQTVYETRLPFCKLMDLDVFNLPLSIAPLAQDVALASEDSFACLLVPRRVLRRVVGSACRFSDITLDGSPRHTHDLIVLAFLMKALRQQGLVKDYVDRAFVSDSNPLAVAFVLKLTPGKTCGEFARALEAEVSNNLSALAEGPTQHQSAAASAGRGPKRVRSAFKDTSLAALRRALTLVKRPTVPVDRIGCVRPAVLELDALLGLPAHHA